MSRGNIKHFKVFVSFFLSPLHPLNACPPRDFILMPSPTAFARHSIGKKTWKIVWKTKYEGSSKMERTKFLNFHEMHKQKYINIWSNRMSKTRFFLILLWCSCSCQSYIRALAHTASPSALMIRSFAFLSFSYPITEYWSTLPIERFRCQRRKKKRKYSKRRKLAVEHFRVDGICKVSWRFFLHLRFKTFHSTLLSHESFSSIAINSPGQSLPLVA